jgi:hypothetical protein
MIVLGSQHSRTLKMTPGFLVHYYHFSTGLIRDFSSTSINLNSVGVLTGYAITFKEEKVYTSLDN